MASQINTNNPSTLFLFLPSPNKPSSNLLSFETLTLTPTPTPSLKSRAPFPNLTPLFVRKRLSPSIELGNPSKSDPIYHNRLVNMLVNRILKDGKKSLAHQIMYRAMKRIQRETGTNPLLVLREAIGRVAPDVVVKSVRVGRRAYPVPAEIGSTQAKALAIRWLLEGARERSGRDMGCKLGSELVDASQGSGRSIMKKVGMHNMAEANRHNSHIQIQ